MRKLRATRHRVLWNTPARMRVVQLSDLHFSSRSLRGGFDRATDFVWRAHPSLVVLTGDYVNYSLKYTSELRRFVRGLPKPCVAILGNHDHWSGAGEVSDALEHGGAEVLANRSTQVAIGRADLEVIGLDDGLTGHADVERAFARAERPNDALVLTHLPATADAIAEKGGRLILAGHTHGGQVHVPVVTRAVHRAIGSPYLAGWYQVGPARLYVNAGLGSSLLPFRAGPEAMPEISVFDLVPHPS
jgi:predicted MPP superfamily phosphohydrolase